MSVALKQFNEVFKKFQFPTSISNALGTAFVNDIRFFNKENRINIDLQFNKIIDEKHIKQFKEEIMKDYSFNICDVNYKYMLSESEPQKSLELYWGNLLKSINEISPVSYVVLSSAKWKFEDNNLVLKLNKNGSFILRGRGIDKTIKNLIYDRLSIDVNVLFKDLEENEMEKDLYLKDLNEMEANLIENLGTNSVALNDKPKETFSQKQGQGGFKKFSGKRSKDVIYNPDLTGVVTKLNEELEMDDDILINGIILAFELRETKSGKFLITFDVTDGIDSITIKFFTQPEKYDDSFKSLLKKGNSIKVLGKVQFDEFSKEVNIMAKEISNSDFSLSKRMDNSEIKRVELHLHTNMSQMDATHTASDYIKKAAKWGHKAIAITDHGVVQAFPEAMETAKKLGVKVLYGVEAYLIDDLGAIVKLPREKTLLDDFVVFDIETTGLDKEKCEIIEIGAVKIVNGEIVDRFDSFVKPNSLLPVKIIELTKITDDMLKDADHISDVLPKFMEFVGDSILVAHNAAFDMGFIQYNCRKLEIKSNNTYLCTVELSRYLLPDVHNHKLGTLAKHFGISLENHHRASDDAYATAEIFLKHIETLKEMNINFLKDINISASKKMDKKKLRHNHAIILVKNYVGLRNLYELVSNSHIEHYNKRPRIPKSELINLKEGLIIGTACEAGEFYKAVRNDMPDEIIDELADFYDYFEIQPLANNGYLVREGIINDKNGLIEINKRIVELGEKYNKPVVATCDVHFMEPEDEIYRKIIMAGSGFTDTDASTPLYFRTTEEMLEEFSYLGKDKAFEVVVENTNLIADMIEAIKPIPDETFPPEIEGSEEELRKITMDKAHEIYGEDLHPLISDRLERELTSIIKNGFAVMYIIAQKLVWNSVENGYLVGSRGSVGSSFVAAMAGITEVNSLPPHYVCDKCKYTDFDSETVKVFAGGSGCDMPDMDCPKCGNKLTKDGHDIPFETFLGFDGDKEPDIDLNFSGEYQAKAHAYTEELFGTGFVFKAGTIGTLAEKTAYGYVRKYMDEKNLEYRNAQVNRLVLGCTGIKKTTGQHPGGLMIVPSNQSIYNFCPIQRPANDQKSDVVTTHFDYHSISGRLLKLDILGHDVPTIIRMLHDFTGVDPRDVDLGDKGVISLFTSPTALGVTTEAINCETGSLGLPEFGTSFVRKMLIDTQPSTFAELVRISGLSHGTDVWFNNAQDLIKDGVATLKEVIPTRDDIMVYLINKGVDKKESFKIMENVRKGKGLTDSEVATMEAAGVPEWYIESCRRIKYMFPKGHAVAYVMMTVRIGYFKIHYPLAFYAASFSVKADAFDYQLMCRGKEGVKEEMRRINALGKEATTKEKDNYTMLELVLEMYERNLRFAPLDIYTADAKKFLIVDDAILPPLCSIQGLGENAAINVVEARKDGEFISYEDFRERTKISKTVIEVMKDNQILKDIPDTNQISLF